MRKIVTFLVALIISGLTLQSCNSMYGELSNDEALLEILYSASKDTITTSSNVLIMRPSVTRNFMPGGPVPRSSRMVATATLFDVDSTTIGSDLEFLKLYVILDKTIWITAPSIIDVFHEDFQEIIASTDGPEWDVDQIVDVIVELNDKLANKKHYLISQTEIIGER